MQQCVQAGNKEYIKALHHCPLVVTIPSAALAPNGTALTTMLSSFISTFYWLSLIANMYHRLEHIIQYGRQCFLNMLVIWVLIICLLSCFMLIAESMYQVGHCLIFLGNTALFTGACDALMIGHGDGELRDLFLIQAHAGSMVAIAVG